MGATSRNNRAPLSTSLLAMLLCVVWLRPATVLAASGDTTLLPRSVLLWTLDPLGVEPEIVANLESLLRLELGRVIEGPVLGLSDLERRLPAKTARKHMSCDGSNACLAKAAAAVGAEVVIAGNVGGLGDRYIVNLKAITAADASELRRIEAPLEGEPDVLIGSVRVAAYRLLAPELLVGSLAVLTEFVGADVLVDGRPVGKTPLKEPVTDIPTGEHALTIRTEGFPELHKTVRVRFQKETSVVVTFTDLGPATDAEAAARAKAAAGLGPKKLPWYGRWWFVGVVAGAALVVGIGVGFAVVPRPRTVCTDPAACPP